MLINSTSVVFGVVWNQGILIVSAMTERVIWQPLGRLKPSVRYCFRMRRQLAATIGLRKTNICF